MDIAGRIELACGALGKTQNEIAEKLGLSPQYLSRLKHGDRSGKKYIKKIAKELHCEVEWLTTGANAPPYAISSLSDIATAKGRTLEVATGHVLTSYDEAQVMAGIEKILEDPLRKTHLTVRQALCQILLFSKKSDLCDWFNNEQTAMLHHLIGLLERNRFIRGGKDFDELVQQGIAFAQKINDQLKWVWGNK
jgi:transcriptional regulator with XRE-family HTH domain